MSFSSISLRSMLGAAVPGWIVAVCLSGAAVPSLAWAAAPGPLEAAEQRAFQQAAEVGAASTVRIEIAGETGAVEDQDAGGTSTGLVVGSEGWIVTSSFAVTDRTAGVIVVIPDGSRYAAKVVGSDPSRKVVLLKIDPPRPLIEPVVAAKADLQVGQWTLGLGRAWGGEAPSIAVGVLSAVDRSWGRGVQTDASISPANYGGPLLDIRGRVIGMLAPLAAESAGMVTGSELYDAGIGFAVPLEDIMAVLPRIRNAGTILLGQRTTFTFGDFSLGPTNVIPTGGFAKVQSPVSVHDFLKHSSVCSVLDDPGFAALAEGSATFAEYEGFPAHAMAVRRRSEAPR